MTNWFLDLRSIYISNGIGVVLLLLLLYISRTRILRRHTEDKIYSFMIIGVLLGCIMEAASYTIDGLMFPGSRILNYVINTYLFTVNLLLPFSLIVYVDLGLYGDTKRIWKHYKPQIFIGLVMNVLNIINYFVPVTYYITEQNVYERRPLSYLYYAVILFYCITGMVNTWRYKKINGTLAFFNIQLFLLPILIGAGLQFMFYGLSLAWLSAAIGLVGMYMMQQNESSYIDSLVDLYNRQYLNHILSSWINRGYSFCGVMVDIDRFKSINDRFGHTEGDNALKTVSDILKKSGLDHEWVFRLAGDEFIILKLSDSADALSGYMDEVEKNLQKHNMETDKYELMLSYGHAFFDSGDIDTFMKEMDDSMYLMKSEHHIITC